jgi:UPF0755 protein
MKKIAAVLVAVVLVVGATAAVLGWLWFDMQRELGSPMPVGRDAQFTVAPGMSLQRISRELKDRCWFMQPRYLEFEGRRLGLARSIKAGEYAVPVGTTPLQLLEIFVSGRVIQYSLTLVEGWTFAQILGAVRASPALVHTLAAEDPRHVMRAIGRAGYFAEGRFLPETYSFPAGTSDVDFLRRANRLLEQVLEEEWQGRAEDLPYASPYQALIMSSLIEKETAVPEERGRIAGVFVRRLKLGMKLQTDPTVIYAVGDAYDGRIRRRDLQYDSPYNTYVHAGLPPTPIAAAGRASIRAALHPEDGDELFFVSRGDGTHEFSRTLAEHNAAVRKYQLGQ